MQFLIPLISEGGQQCIMSDNSFYPCFVCFWTYFYGHSARLNFRAFKNCKQWSQLETNQYFIKDYPDFSNRIEQSKCTIPLKSHLISCLCVMWCHNERKTERSGPEDKFPYTVSSLFRIQSEWILHDLKARKSVHEFLLAAFCSFSSFLHESVTPTLWF